MSFVETCLPSILIEFLRLASLPCRKIMKQNNIYVRIHIQNEKYSGPESLGALKNWNIIKAKRDDIRNHHQLNIYLASKSRYCTCLGDVTRMFKRSKN